MKPGRVVSIRVNTKDCMSVIDVVEKIGLNIPGISFAQIVSTALASTLESLRQAGVIPIRDGFEFSEMMNKYPPVLHGARGRALSIANTMQSTEDSQVPAVMSNRVLTKACIRLDELLLKVEADPLNVTLEIREEMEKLTELLTGRSRG